MDDMTNEQWEKSKELFNEFSKNASEADVTKISQDLAGMNKGPIKQVWDSVQKLWAMIKDKDAAWVSKSIAIGALLYLVSPIDAIPDFIPVLGLADDAAVITAAIASLATALKKYDSKTASDSE